MMLFQPGSVHLLDMRFMRNHPDVRWTRRSDGDKHPVRPFVCIDANSTHSQWVSLVGSTGKSRVRIEPSEKFGNDPAWAGCISWCDDPSYVVTVRHSAFRSIMAKKHVKQSISRAALDRIIAAVNSPEAIANRTLPGGKSDPRHLAAKATR